ncbi:MAG: alpha/beta hydrolase [Microbacterium sp.]|uniref:alpha/beta hydrolase n=1 Tax=Microbacterium sp. TaxID=51671 RepID=UPI003F95C755
MLHGGGQRRHSWRRTGEWLADAGWSAWAFDARGHGDSARAPEGDYSVSALVDDVIAIIEEIGDPPVLVGASMGGMTSLIAEGEHGPRALALVLVDIVARVESEGSRKIQTFMRSAPNGFATLDEASDAIAAYNPHRPRPKSLDGLRKNLVQRDDGRWHWHWDSRFLQRGTEPELEIRYERSVAAAQRITVPTLLVRVGNQTSSARRAFARCKILFRTRIPSRLALPVT